MTLILQSNGNNTINKEANTTYYQKKNFPADKNEIIKFASKISNNNLDFIATLDKESAGSWDVNIKSKPNKNKTYDKGICQFNSAYYKHYYNDPNWSNYEWQITKCWHLYDSAIKRGKIKTTFYGYNKRQASKKNFELITIK